MNIIISSPKLSKWGKHARKDPSVIKCLMPTSFSSEEGAVAETLTQLSHSKALPPANGQPGGRLRTAQTGEAKSHPFKAACVMPSQDTQTASGSDVLVQFCVCFCF